MRRLLWLAPPVAVTVLGVEWGVHVYRKLMRDAEACTAYAVAELSGPWDSP